MKKILFFIFPLVFFLHSCEEIVEGETLPHDEKLVVRAVLIPNETPFLKLTKTLPPLDDYTPEKAEVTDADVRLSIDGEEFQGQYRAWSVDRPDLAGYIFTNAYQKILPGKNYSLKIRWRNKTATSTMRIPEEPEIVSLKMDSVKRRYYDGYETWTKTLNAKVRPRTNESYVLTFEVKSKTSSNRFLNEYFGNVKGFDEVGKDGFVEISGNDSYSSSFNFNSEDMIIIAHVHAFDSQFAEYFKTRYDNHSDVTFREPTKVKWNVFGNAIGMFTGYSTAVDTLEF